MIQKKIVVGLILALFSVSAAVGDSAPTPSEPARAILRWLDAVGLKDTFDYIDDYRTWFFGNYVLVLDAHQLEAVMGNEPAKAIYKRLFSKLLAETNLPPMDIELRVQSREGGWCDPSVIENNIRMKGEGLVSERKVISNPVGIFCSLDFESIRRYIEKTKTSVSNSGIANFPSAVSPPTTATIAIIRQELEKRYRKSGASIAITGSSDSWLSMLVTRIRGEVISDKSYWERLQIMVLLEPRPNEVHIRLILDGKYGAGLAAPSEQGYVDMEPTYTANLVNYGKQLSVALASGEK